MTPERWRQVEEIFQAALDLSPGDRTRYVSEVCATDAELRRDVEVLLSQYDSAGELLEEPIYGNTELNMLGSFVEEKDPMIGRRLGSYRIDREIGRGGMGAVYEASRADNEFNKRAAIKLVKRGMDTDFILRRFRKERQILAALDHPHIGGLLDGGTTEDGLPYFVMEYIEGQPLYTYCDSHKLNITERLKLFRSICDAVHYAHQKQVVHRDIKPSNVLVTSEGVPKLLDFGIAKLLNPQLAGDITHDPTATAMRLMTPEYASPEQVQGAPTTPTTDVYSLGVLLYELLTGHRPYRLVNRAPHEIARVICEEAPAPPSIIITRAEDLLPSLSTGDEATTLKQLYTTRGSTLEALRRALSGDLDNIVMQALRKEPEWRYQTAADLRDDITRFLEGRPILDLPDPPNASMVLRPDSTAENSLAVLPLKLMDINQPETNPDYLGTGLADALITRLSAIRSFAVRPTSSVLRYGADADPLRAGRELGVAFVLDGRIRRAAERIRVTIQLLNVRDETTAWAGQFDEQGNQVVADYIKRAADGLERFSGAMRDRDLSSLMGDAEDFARRQPAVFIGAGVAVGFLLARFLRSSSERREAERYGYQGDYGYASGSAAESSYGRHAYQEGMTQSPDTTWSQSGASEGPSRRTGESEGMARQEMREGYTGSSRPGGPASRGSASTSTSSSTSPSKSGSTSSSTARKERRNADDT